MEQKFGTQQTNDLAYLVGKRFVVGSEGERGQKLAEGKIKLMTFTNAAQLENAGANVYSATTALRPATA